ncbi:MAG: lipid-A-disaccharide synthase [Candidatus Omnitrophica bacterium]|nr:lipid-A-disaccharide synthase [Candidatus Omnitrophota bacterium]MDD5488209.1 lipid-A-disaccharide synthase [Candidatus Omnitrophota bacterium]
MSKNILIIAGEPSGDMRGSELLKELRPLLPGTSFWGVGGDMLSSQGMELFTHIRSFSLVGISELLTSLFKIRRQFASLKAEAIKRRPSMAILIDYPGFNLRMARFLKKNGIPVVYYVVPQIWAWGEDRVRYIKNHVSLPITLFRFEKDLLAKHGIFAEYAGHPLVDMVPDGTLTRDPATPPRTIGLLPGSRTREVENLLPTMLAACRKIRGNKDVPHILLAKSSNVNAELYNNIVSTYGTELRIKEYTDDAFSCLSDCDIAVVASGTATLETAMMERPMVIVYKSGFLTYALFKLFAKVRDIGLVNVVAGRTVVPELLQNDFTPEKLSRHLLDIINDRGKREAMLAAIREVKRSLGEKGAAGRAAKAIARFAGKDRI